VQRFPTGWFERLGERVAGHGLVVGRVHVQLSLEPTAMPPWVHVQLVYPDGTTTSVRASDERGLTSQLRSVARA
jgi:predicted oxidoreductase